MGSPVGLVVDSSLREGKGLNATVVMMDLQALALIIMVTRAYRSTFVRRKVCIGLGIFSQSSLGHEASGALVDLNRRLSASKKDSTKRNGDLPSKEVEELILSKPVRNEDAQTSVSQLRSLGSSPFWAEPAFLPSHRARVSANTPGSMGFDT
jgi:hypothetical protein